MEPITPHLSHRVTAFRRFRPQRALFLQRIDLGLDGVTEMDWLVNVEKKTPRDAARTWMQANESRVAGWLKG